MTSKINKNILLSTCLSFLFILEPSFADEINDVVRSRGMVLTKTSSGNNDVRIVKNGNRVSAVIKSTETHHQRDNELTIHKTLSSDEIAEFISKIPEHPNNNVVYDNLTEREKRYYDSLDTLVSNLVLPNSVRNSSVKNNTGFIRPVNYRINSGYGMRKHPIHGDVRMHTGVDFAAPMGTPIKSVQSGQVVFSGTKGGYGKTVIIKHNDRYSTLYGHASKLNVSVGQFVNQGDIIALVGSTGVSTGPHLHFEVFEYGKRINPASKIM